MFSVKMITAFNHIWEVFLHTTCRSLWLSSCYVVVQCVTTAVANLCCSRRYRERTWTWMTTVRLKIWNKLASRYSRRLWRVEASSVVVHCSSEQRDCSWWRVSATMTYHLHCSPNHHGNSGTWTFRSDFMMIYWTLQWQLLSFVFTAGCGQIYKKSVM